MVSHHLAGFLRHSPRHRGCRARTLAGVCAESRRLVASCCQSWGSPRFWLVAPVSRSHHRRPRRIPTPRRIPPILSRTVSPRPVPSCRSPAAFDRPYGFALPQPPFNLSLATSVGFKALLCGWVRTTVRRFRQPMAYPPVGFWFPSKVLRSRSAACAVDRDEQPGRLRGPVTVPAEHIPVGSAAAPIDAAVRRSLVRAGSGVPRHLPLPRSLWEKRRLTSYTRRCRGRAGASDHRRLISALPRRWSVWTMIRLESLCGFSHGLADVAACVPPWMGLRPAGGSVYP